MSRIERVKLLLQRMRQAALDAHEFCKDMDRAAFGDNLIVQRAVAMSLFMAGETAVQLEDFAPDFAADHPEIPWHAVRGMRNRMAHGYFDINQERVFDTAKTEALELAVAIGAILDIHPQGE
ncbi:HepT-like ribonuclease domain-containing protein [Rhizobium sp. CECT 9324]|uniref:HepT-like ribonuclease domain-containing protein n=1 Tax=Rhizobium sp. CECT 9324 TaxID=2845820 RepID=UPI000DDD5C68|nr:HepT-like ribonuclease domain-containing protein [Rhizobium sp. CECT 9324]CAH0341543.1 hypothetical protein RHI9324_03239 [Rhizobium sp. CECT 9324]